MPTLDQLLALETQVWRALVDGNADADARLLSHDFIGVYSTGFADRDDHSRQLEAGPTVLKFAISDARVMQLSSDAGLLIYRADYSRPSRAGDPIPGSMYISSLWCNRDGSWDNVFSQDTDTV